MTNREGETAMEWLGWVVLAAVLGGGAYIPYSIHKHLQGPSHCMGCGKCGENGICILTGEPVGPRRRTREEGK